MHYSTCNYEINRRRKNSRNTIQSALLFCRKFLKRDGLVNHLQTFFCYSICKIPFYKEHRIDLVAGRKLPSKSMWILMRRIFLAIISFIVGTIQLITWLIHTLEEVARNTTNDDEHAWINYLFKFFLTININLIKIFLIFE